MRIGIKVYLIPMTLRTVTGLFGSEVDCGQTRKADYCSNCELDPESLPSSTRCGGDCDWQQEEARCVLSEGGQIYRSGPVTHFAEQELHLHTCRCRRERQEDWVYTGQPWDCTR